jgi:hypothetical protein
MEYLMSYGWAILIIIVVIGALWKMGVFDPTHIIPCNPCFSYFVFRDYSDGSLIIANGNTEIELIGVEGANSYEKRTYFQGETFEIGGIPTEGEVDIYITYEVEGLPRIDSATLHNWED